MCSVTAASATLTSSLVERAAVIDTKPIVDVNSLLMRCVSSLSKRESPNGTSSQGMIFIDSLVRYISGVSLVAGDMNWTFVLVGWHWLIGNHTSAPRSPGLKRLTDHDRVTPPGPTLPSSESTVVMARCLACDFPKHRRKRARLTKANGEPDLGHRMFSLCQHYLGVFYAPICMVPMRRHAKRLLERPAKVKGAQSSHPRESGDRNLIGQVFLDVGADDPLLPCGQTTPDGGIEARWSAILACEFMD